MSITIDTCKDCDGGCEFHLEEWQYIDVPELQGKKLTIIVKTEWLSRTIKKLGFICLDEFLDREHYGKAHLVQEVYRIAKEEKAIRIDI